MGGTGTRQASRAFAQNKKTLEAIVILCFDE